MFSALLSYIVLPFLATIALAFYYGISLSNMAIVISMILMFVASMMEQNENLARKEKETTDMRISVMMSQIAPHFICNTLNSIAGLCESNPAEAKETTLVFSEDLRGNLNALSETDLITFGRELAHVKYYLAIQILIRVERMGVFCYNADMELQKLYSKVRQAVDAYQMIEDGDKIAIGISGGKDSLTLLYALAGMRKFYPKKYDVVAITVDTGVGNMDFSKVKELCESLNVPYEIIPTQIFPILMERQEKRMCPLCAKLRKGAFNEAALRLGCNKIAYAHHKDDVVETFLMSQVLEGRVHTFSPVTHLDGTELDLIRPLVYVTEAEVRGFMRRYQLPVVKNLCPVDGATKREAAKRMLARMEEEFPKAKSRIFAAIQRDHIDGW